MVTTNQKPVIDMQKERKEKREREKEGEESKYMTKESSQIMREESKRKEQKITTQTTIKQVRKRQ